MPSVGSFKAQPITHSFITTADTSTTGSHGPDYFTQADIDSWIASNTMTVLGSLLIIPSADFSSTLGNLDRSGTWDDRKTLRDLGKEYVIGNELNSRIIVLRKVMYNNTSDVGGLNGTIGYIPIENNATEPNGNYGRFAIRVARV